MPARDEVERRLSSDGRVVEGMAREANVPGALARVRDRSALALKLLVFAHRERSPPLPRLRFPSRSAASAIGTTASHGFATRLFTLDALLRLGCPAEAEAFFWWLMHSSHLTHPELHVLYGLRGGAFRTRKRAWPGWLSRLAAGSNRQRGGRAAPARRLRRALPNRLSTCAAAGHNRPRFGRRLAQTADLVCRIWQEPDSGIWEVRSEPVHFTQSKMSCWRRAHPRL